MRTHVASIHFSILNSYTIQSAEIYMHSVV